MIDSHPGVAILRPLGLELELKSVQVTLDEGWSPYCQATIVAVLPVGDDRAAVDLRTTALRLDLRLSQAFGEGVSLGDITAEVGGGLAALTALVGGSLAAVTNRYYTPWNGATVRPNLSRLFDLYVTEREFDDVTRELTIVATSDEALVHGGALLSTVSWDPGTTSLKAIVALVLARYGAFLDASSADATVAQVSATIQKPGVADWEYLDPMLEAASLRLWCDEQRIWRISSRQQDLDTSMTITPEVSMTGHRDKMTLNPETWFDAVVRTYRWTDALGVSQEAVDVAGTSPAKAVNRITTTGTVYPGSGAAAGILARAAGRGRVLEVEAISDPTTTPGMAVTIIPPDTIAQTGHIAAVTWRVPAARMQVTTRGLVDTPPDSFFFGDDVTFTDVATTAPLLAVQDFDWSLV